MASGEETAQAAGSGTYNSAIPWNQIPKFIPGETDLRTYTRKLEFLQSLWPKDQLEHLGPRAALAVEGVAFQKISRLDPTKLREPDGVSYLVKALGGQWGKLDAEDKYDLFERALYQVSQKQDESHDSYLARHDAAFEDLLNRKVSLEEVRAYVLMRQSLLTSEERKRVIMDSQGELTYDGARKQIRLLGSRFFQDLQAGTGGRGTKLKTYDVNYIDEEPVYFQEEAAEEVDDELLVATLAEEGDEDANFVQEFEEQIMVACQESSELSGCFMAYQEARSRLKEKARSRGFWPLTGQKGREKGKWNRAKGKGHGFQKGSMVSPGNVQMGRRKTLADRIANSTCRRCGKPGHWKRECPLGASSSSAGDIKKITDGEAFTGIMTDEYLVVNTDKKAILDEGNEVISQLPASAQCYQYGTLEVGKVSKIHVSCGDGTIQNSPKAFHGDGCDNPECVFLGVGEKSGRSLQQTLVHHLRKCCRNTDSKTAVATPTHEPVRSDATFLQSHEPSAGGSEIFNAEEAADEAIIDTGASRAVIGSGRLEMLVQSFPPEIRRRVMKVPTDGIVFKFGNAGRLSSDYAVLLPRAQNDWLRVEVVPGQTPFLISNAVLGKLRGVVDVEGRQLGFKGSDVWIPLFGVRKNLLGVKVMDLLMKAPRLNTRAQTHILLTQETQKGDAYSTCQHAQNFLHDLNQNSSDGIQNQESCFLKENVTENLQQNLVNPNAAIVLSEEVSPQVKSVLKDPHRLDKAMESPVPYLARMLTSPVDESLKDTKVFQDVPTTLTRPPGVANLAEWGTMKIPSGKHQSKTFATVYEKERSYVNQVWNRKAVAPWLRSFQLYCRHRREASVDHHEGEAKRQGLQMPISPHMTPEVAELIRAGGAPWLTPRTNDRLIKEKNKKDAAQKSNTKEENEWTHVSEIEKGNKRSLPSQNNTMETQPNAEKIAQLQAQIAALQRDLNVELTGQAWQSEAA